MAIPVSIVINMAVVLSPIACYRYGNSLLSPSFSVYTMVHVYVHVSVRTYVVHGYVHVSLLSRGWA